MWTMDQEYSDGSPHECCQTCGMCRTCGDCKCFDNFITCDGGYICQICGQGEMVLSGRKTLGSPVDRKAFCPLCLHEEDF